MNPSSDRSRDPERDIIALSISPAALSELQDIGLVLKNSSYCTSVQAPSFSNFLGGQMLLHRVRQLEDSRVLNALVSATHAVLYIGQKASKSSK
jgi:hypothetical protein